MEGAGATWRPPSGARSPGRGATPAGRSRQHPAERGKQGRDRASGTEPSSWYSREDDEKQFLCKPITSF
ncbi:unnamed protein product [Coccothraustes coccothraustes]